MNIKFRKFRNILFLALGFFMVLNYQNCAPVHEGEFASVGSSSLPPFPAILSSGLQRDCQSCHAGVSSPEVFATTFSAGGVPWINLQDPENSLVLKSVRKESGVQGMPLGQVGDWGADVAQGGAPTETDALREWLLSIETNEPAEPDVDLGPATYTSVSGVIQQYCISCHSGSDNHPLTTYDQVVAYVDTSGQTMGQLYEEIASENMPREPVQMTDASREAVKDLLFEWITTGALNN